jgi:hypothetical protein
MKKCLFWSCLIFSLLGAFFFRFFNLTNQGFISWDEGMYMNEVSFYESIIHNFKLLGPKLINHSLDGADLIASISGWPPSSAKPLHSFLIYTFTFLLGNRPFTAQAMAAFFGIGNCLMLYFLVKEYYGKIIALGSLILLSFSGYHIYISRIGAPETNSIFFFLWSLLLIGVNSPSRSALKSFWVGFTYSLCFCMNYRWIIVLPAIYMQDVLSMFCAKGSDIKNIWRNIFLISLGIIVMPLLCESVYLPLGFVSDFSVAFRHIPENVLTYKDQLIHYLLFQSSSGSYIIHDLYPRFFIGLNGILLTSLSLMGFLLLCLKPRLKHCVFIFVSFVPFVLLSTKSRGNSLRYISIVLPFLAFYASFALNYIFANIKIKKTIKNSLVVIAYVLIIITSARNAVPFLRLSSGYENAAHFLKTNNGERNLSTSNPYFEYYFGRNISEQIPKTLSELQTILEKENYAFIVLDFMSHRVLSLEAKIFIETFCQPVFTTENPIGVNKYTLMESLGYRHFIPGYIEKALNDSYAKYITIYKASDVLEALRSRM